ncbi:MAG: hypothetical protein IT178_08740 [Acidobacteria bacterium]|nr:hypothetical protein [Acidobacteriota bacterium]
MSISIQAQEPPLPDLSTFLKEARTRLEPDEMRQSGYVYVETRRERKLDASGKTLEEDVNVYESFPGLPGERRFQRQTQRDGQPVPAAELARVDRERQQKIAAYRRRMDENPAQARAEEARARAKQRRQLSMWLDDAEAVYEFTMKGREVVNGHRTIVLGFTPRPNVTPRTREGRWMTHFAGTAWVSESEFELVKLDAEALDTVTFGWGLFARVHKGSRASLERRKVDGDVWLPARASYTASARVMLVRMMRVGGTSEFSNYRKFNVAKQ